MDASEGVREIIGWSPISRDEMRRMVEDGAAVRVHEDSCPLGDHVFTLGDPVCLCGETTAFD